MVRLIVGGKLARTHAQNDDASEEEEDWYDASEDVEEEPPQATSSWWEQDNVNAADVESNLLKDIHQKGMSPDHWAANILCYQKVIALAACIRVVLRILIRSAHLSALGVLSKGHSQ